MKQEEIKKLDEQQLDDEQLDEVAGGRARQKEKVVEIEKDNRIGKSSV